MNPYPDPYTKKIRQISKRILSEGKVDAVIGFRRGSLGVMSEPFIAKTQEATESLTFDCNCRMNLVTYLTNRTDKIGILVKGCDSRNLVTHIIENKIKREQLYIIGVPCTGLADKAALIKAAGSEILSVEDNGETLVVNCGKGEKKIARKDVLQANCKTCIKRNPVIFDELAGPMVAELEIKDRFFDVEKIEALRVEEKQNFFDALLSGCTRCYACRNACPLCYCPTCFVDGSRPQWVGKTTDPTDIKTWHLLRAFHDAGRCTDCGACEAACPMDIKIRVFTRKTIKECVEKYGWETGLDPEQRPALDQFKPNEPEEFIR
ncbi:MAG: 4Fe-4S dicluster domain-containing protein [Desulfobacula sp.]|jgi:formate dehydrogenase subunit beta|nr:4Fe-4S dicluster domain-containing protein [Desulfobacula sp.]